ncbi:MAG: diguanylate cyclase [Candidatus Omnitrophica bacterium]|nr:diguanylate cyclase [Candidatus Omnitrophota bacterium]
MRGIFKSLALIPKGLRYKLMLAFSLMSIIPLLVSVYLINLYIFPRLDNFADVSLAVLFSVLIALLGLILAKKLIDPIIEIAIEAKVIAGGGYDKKIAVSSDDEIGVLGESINIMTQKIKSNLDELKNYGQKTREINLEIHKKVLALTNLLQVGDMISAGSIEIDRVLELAVQKASATFDNGYGIIYMPRDGEGDFYVKASSNIEQEALADLVIKKRGHNLLEKALFNRSMLIIDSGVKESKEVEHFRSAYNVKNMVALPLYSSNTDLAVLVIGNREDDFKFRNEDLDLIKVFAKQISIAIENEVLFRKNKELVIKDELTGLYNKNYILPRMEDEIRRAVFCQRPCSFMIFNIDDFKKMMEQGGELEAEEIIKKVAKLIKDNTSPIGKIARIGGDEFAVLLPEKNKKEAMEAAEGIRIAVEKTFSKDGKPYLTVSAGVSENPIDGATQDEILKKALEALRQAKSSGKNRVSA